MSLDIKTVMKYHKEFDSNIIRNILIISKRISETIRILTFLSSLQNVIVCFTTKQHMPRFLTNFMIIECHNFK